MAQPTERLELLRERLEQESERTEGELAQAIPLLRSAELTARALRDAGVPLADVAEVVAGSGALDALHVHRQRVLDERAREDLAFTSAEQTLRALDRPVAVVEREAIEQLMCLFGQPPGWISRRKSARLQDTGSDTTP